ncbi:hypothetical protein [Nocardia jinanensis]|uniref:hypothetical protein n=1 Tax=Nocardia jinanensis TaxID=382504 RepID=UPI001E46E667|nr:hypothetical protein [Nocardia jinanensis]
MATGPVICTTASSTRSSGIDFEIDDVVLAEGQCLGRFDETTAAETQLAYETTPSSRSSSAT